MSAAEPDSVLTFASHVLIPTSDIIESGEVKAAAKVVTDETGAVLAKKKENVWEVPPELDARQVVPGRIHQLLFTNI